MNRGLLLALMAPLSILFAGTLSLPGVDDDGSAPAAAARRLLMRADAAMYAAKSAGKRRARHAAGPRSLDAPSDVYGA